MKLILFSLTIVALSSCIEIVSARNVSKDSSNAMFESNPGLTQDTSVPRRKSNVNPKYSTKTDVLGAWAAVGDENASFLIQKDRVIYPEDTKKYTYEIIKDSIRFNYGGYKVTCKLEFRGKDTLVLKGYDTTVYYRFKD